MKNNWQTKKLGEVCDILDNQRRPITKKHRVAGEFPYYGATGILDYVADYIFDEKLVLIGEDGAKWESGEWTAFIVSGKYWVNNHAHAIRTHGDIILDKWVVFFFYFTDLTKYTTGLTVPKLNQASLRNIQIPVPTLAEQERIVKILDEVFEDIERAKKNTEKNLKNAKELFESYLQSVFANNSDGWEKKRIDETCELKSGTTISPSLERKSGNVLYTKIADMNLPENFIEMRTSSRFVNNDEIKISQIIPEGAIIFPKRGGAIATNKKRKVVKPTIVDLNTMAIIPSNKIDKDYFYHWFKLIDLNNISNGTSIPQINNYSFDEVYIPYPISIKEQKAIVKKLDELSEQTKKLEENYKKKLEDLKELKKSVLNKAFNGEL